MGELLTILYVGTQDEVNQLREWIRETPYKGSRVFHAPSISTIPNRSNFSLIITSFPDGIETLSTLKQFYPMTAILYLGDDDDLADQAITDGAQDYLPLDEIDPIYLTRSITFAIERESHQSQLQEKSFTDDLTGIYNRRGFMTLMQQQMELTKRSNQGFMLFMFDLDFFKEINDHYGHPAGDEALIQTANALVKAFRSHDIVGRLGGDEFAVLALNARPDRAGILKRHLFQRLKEINAADTPYKISLSIGTVYYGGGDQTIKELLTKVDKDLYQEKKKRHHAKLGGEERM